MSGRWLGLALVLLSSAAQAGEQWKLQLLGCGDEEPSLDPALLEALELELGAVSDPARYTVRVRWPCDADAMGVVSVEDLAARLESRVDLSATPREQWDRVIALVARQLLHDARRVALTALEVAASASALPAAPEPALPMPAPAPAPVPKPGFALQAALGARAYPSRPTGLFGGGIEGAWRWARAGLWAQGTRVTSTAAAIDGTMVTAQLGAMPFRFRQDLWQLGVGAFLEAGWAHSTTAALLPGYHGTSANAPVGGLLVRTELGYRPSPRFAINLSLNVGYDLGLRVNVFTVPTVDLGGAFVEARLGFEL